MPQYHSPEIPTQEVFDNGSCIFCRGEDIRKREGVRKRPRSARRSKSRSSRGERDSRVTLSEGSYEEVKLTDSEYESGDEETFVEDRGCQTGWELFVQYDQVCHLTS